MYREARLCLLSLDPSKRRHINSPRAILASTCSRDYQGVQRCQDLLGIAQMRLQELQPEDALSSQIRKSPSQFQQQLDNYKLELIHYLNMLGYGDDRIDELCKWLDSNLEEAQKQLILQLWLLAKLLRLLVDGPTAASFAEFPNNLRPPCTTMPWIIVPALFVLWGVCWMFYGEPTGSFNTEEGDNRQTALTESPQLLCGDAELSYFLGPLGTEPQPELAFEPQPTEASIDFSLFHFGGEEAFASHLSHSMFGHDTSSSFELPPIFGKTTEAASSSSAEELLQFLTPYSLAPSQNTLTWDLSENATYPAAVASNPLPTSIPAVDRAPDLFHDPPTFSDVFRAREDTRDITASGSGSWGSPENSEKDNHRFRCNHETCKDRIFPTLSKLQ